MALVAHFFILFSEEKGQVLNSIQKTTFNHSLLDILDFYTQYKGKKVHLPWTESPFFVFCMQNQLAFLKDISLPTSNSDSLPFI